MPVTTYTVIEGEVVSQNQDGTIHDFLPDPLGHTLGLISTDETIEFEWDYFPYEQVPTAFDGATALRYGGTRGYYSDTYSRPHVGARELRTVHGRWMQVDPIWPWELAYPYVDGTPVTSLDPTGLRRSIPSCTPPARKYWNDYIVDFCRDCYARNDYACIIQCSQLAEDYYRLCQKLPPQTSGQIWVIEPGVGVVPSPKPCISAGTPPCTIGPMPPGWVSPTDPNDCYKIAMRDYPRTYNFRGCVDCCAGTADYDACRRACWAGQFISCQLWVNQFGKQPSGTVTTK